MPANEPLPFLLENPNLELCSICGLKKPLTFEHMPPQASGNTHPVNLVGLENITSAGGYLYGKYKKSPRGMGRYSLCKNCNSLTGSWYGESYIEFSEHVKKVISENADKDNVEFEFNLKPLNFLKQVICLLLSADQATGTLRGIINETNFILDKEEKQLSPKLRNIYQYYTLSSIHRFQGYIPMWDDKKGISAEMHFLYRPFLFKSIFIPEIITPAPFNLIQYAKYDYNQEVKIKSEIHPSILLRISNFEQ